MTKRDNHGGSQLHHRNFVRDSTVGFDSNFCIVFVPPNDSARGFMTWSHPATEEYCCSVHKFEQQGRSSVLVSAGELHVRFGVQGL